MVIFQHNDDTQQDAQYAHANAGPEHHARAAASRPRMPVTGLLIHRHRGRWLVRPPVAVPRQQVPAGANGQRLGVFRHKTAHLRPDPMATTAWSGRASGHGSGHAPERLARHGESCIEYGLSRSPQANGIETC